MNEETKSKMFEAILEKAKNDNQVIGLILVGGRGKGVFTENSDYDVVIVTTDETTPSTKEEYKGEHNIISIGIRSLSEFKNHDAMRSEEEWNRWNRYAYAHIKALVDKTGEIQTIIDEKGILPKNHITEVTRNALEGYLNSLCRSIKNHRDGNLFASHFDATESLSSLLLFLFAVEGRIRPYNKFLRWELENYPLKNLPMRSDDFLRKLEEIVKSGDIKLQKELHNFVEKIALKSDCTDIIEGWKGFYFSRE